MLRSFNRYVATFYSYWNLVFGNPTFQDENISSELEGICREIFRLLEERRNGRGQKESALWLEVVGKLITCTNFSFIGDVLNTNGFNVLLQATLNGDTDVLQLLIDFGCDVNISRCTLPLHLACRCGRLDIVKFLLKNGAQLHSEAGMCYPQRHTPLRHVPSRFHFIETDIYACDSNHLSPIMYAIMGDNEEIVEELMRWERKAVRPWSAYHPCSTPRFPLHFACQIGAIKCAKHLCTVLGDQINCADSNGMTPLLHAVPHSLSLVRCLAELGADVHARNSLSQSALHVLCENNQANGSLCAISRYLLGVGIEQDILHRDSEGNTALHCVVGLINKATIQSKHREKVCLSPADNNLVIAEDIRNTMKLFLAHNCDPNISNKVGLTVLHKLFLSLDSAINPEANTELYRPDTEELTRCLEILLSCGVDVNALTGSGRSSILILLQIISSSDLRCIALHKEGLLQILDLLCRRGVLPSMTESLHSQCILTISRLGREILRLSDKELQEEMSEVMLVLLRSILQSGLRKNQFRRLASEAKSTNILVAVTRFIPYARAGRHLLIIRSWLQCLLQWGVDPDFEPYPPESIICHSQSSIFLKPKGTQAVSQFMYDFLELFPEAQQLLLLFYNSMDHSKLYQAFDTARFLSRFDPGNAPKGPFLQHINQLSSQPRSLKTIARVKIYQSIQHQLVSKVPFLPLPKPLQRYLINIE